MLSCGLLLAAWARAGSAPGQDVAFCRRLTPLPEGNTGIASKYLSDVGIDKDPAVLLHDDFSSKESAQMEQHGGNLPATCLSFVEYPESVHPGEKAL